MEKFSSSSSSSNGRLIRLNCLLTICFALWLYLLFFNVSKPAGIAPPPPIASPTDWCAGRYVYVHSLPSKFNSDLITACHNLSKWTDMCRYVANAGLGPLIEDSDGVFAKTGWYATNQFALELIFHNRMKQYDCITSDSALASTIYVPFYAGLDIGRYLWGYNTSVRDSAAADLIHWLTSRPEWARMGGRDHFLVAGRITWDFRRLSESGLWGNNFLFMPEVKNMSVLVIESSPWHGNDFGVPYPTYFHPSTNAEIVSWQERIRRLERPWLFSFAGAPRPNMTESIRGQLINQCRSSGRCKLLECHMGASKCHSPNSVMKMFQSSVFCLQPQGDSYTRRSAYSVFTPEDEVRDGKVSVEEVLMGLGEEEVRRMREEVVGLIPRLVYRDPRAKMEGMKDAFDVAVEGVTKRVEELRDLSAGVEDEHNSWRSSLLVRGREHERDHFFSK